MLPPDLLRLLKVFRPARFWFGLGIVMAVFSFLISLVLTAAALLYFAAGVTAAVIILRAIAPLRTLSRYAERLVTHNATFHALAALRLWFFRQVAPLAPARLGFSRSGDMLNRITSDIDALDGFYLRLIVPAAGALIALMTFITFGLKLTPQLVLLVICWGGLLFLLLRGVIKSGSQASGAGVERLADLRTHVVDGIDGLGELMANEAGHLQQVRIAESTRALVQQQLTVSRATLHTTALMGLFASGTMVLLLMTGLTLPQETSWRILLMLAVVMALTEALGAALPGWLASGRLAKAARRLLAITDQTPLTDEPAAPLPLPEKLSLRFENVGLSYGRPRPALDHLSFTLEAGERVILTGPSGAGKSSILGLILGFWTPETGRILVGDIDLALLSRNTLRRKIGYLSQRTQLLSGTVRANLLLANPGASEEQIWAALQAAEIDTVIKSLPEGLDTWTGEAGILLSGGQARRLAIAQLILRQADIWLLDEPTEGLDFDTARSVLSKLGQLAGPRSVVLITHQNELIEAFGPARPLKLAAGRIQET